MLFRSPRLDGVLLRQRRTPLPRWCRQLFVRAATLAIPADAQGAARARSNAEAFLWKRLETLPETRGRFELNGRLPIPYAGVADMEVDLLDRQSRLAIEIDGFHHFSGENAWRRDRRKDFLLQHAGYLVFRVLASDVTRRLDEILDTISVALRSRARLATLQASLLHCPSFPCQSGLKQGDADSHGLVPKQV